MLEVVALVLLTLGLPVLINKSTETHFEWVKPYLRPLWTAICAFYSLYLLNRPGAVEVAVQFHQRFRNSAFLGYAVVAICGAALLCGYWWFTGKAFSNAAAASAPAQTERYPTASEIASEVARHIPTQTVGATDHSDAVLVKGKDAELCTRTFTLTRRIRDFGRRTDIETTEMVNSHREAMMSLQHLDPSSESRTRLWRQHMESERRLSETQRFEFRTTILTEALYVKTELVKRFPDAPKLPSNQEVNPPWPLRSAAFFFDGTPLGRDSFFSAADYLDLLAKRLCP